MPSRKSNPARDPRYVAKHHPFTSVKAEDEEKMKSAPGDVRANAYDLVIICSHGFP